MHDLTLAISAHPMRSASSIFARYAAAIVFSTYAGQALAQAHEVKTGDYVLRGSTVSSLNLSPESASANGIERDARRAVLNVTVLKQSRNAENTVRARVQASSHDLAGVQRDVPLREVTANGWVSYVGTYSFNHGEVLDFVVTAQPEDDKQQIELRFRERMWARGDLPDVPRKR